MAAGQPSFRRIDQGLVGLWLVEARTGASDRRRKLGAVGGRPKEKGGFSRPSFFSTRRFSYTFFRIVFFHQ